jgi:hypothetical protein
MVSWWGSGSWTKRSQSRCVVCAGDWQCCFVGGVVCERFSNFCFFSLVFADARLCNNFLFVFSSLQTRRPVAVERTRRIIKHQTKYLVHDPDNVCDLGKYHVVSVFPCVVMLLLHGAPPPSPAPSLLSFASKFLTCFFQR